MEKKIGTLIKVYKTERVVMGSNGVENKYDALILFYRDKDGVKQTKFIDRAEIPFYVLKDKESPEAFSPQMFIERDKVEESTAYSDMLFREMAIKTNALSYYDRVALSWGKESSNMKNLFKHNLLYDSDMDIEDRYIAKFYEEYEPDPEYKLHKCYFDIEVDLMQHGFTPDDKGNIGYMGFPEEDVAPCPINIVSLFDQKDMKFYTFVLRNNKNESLKDFEKGINDFKEYIIKKTASEDDTIINDIDFLLFDDELDMLQTFMNVVHRIDPDFMLGWNICFDVKTILNRIKHLISARVEYRKDGINAWERMKTIACDPKYMTQYDRKGNPVFIKAKAYYYAQKGRPQTDRIDSYTVVDGINWMDQEYYYANIRKTQGKKESYKLDDIAFEELEKEKLEFGPGENHKNLPWLDFLKFAEYNIRDVLLLHLLELNLLDMDMLQRLGDITLTRKDKVFRKTISLKNFVNKFARSAGYILNNNKNATYGKDGYFFEQNFLQKVDINEYNKDYRVLFELKDNFGAFVADPNLNLPDNGMSLNGRLTQYLFEYVFDEDFAALYPSIIRSFNLDINTQVGKFYLKSKYIKEKLMYDHGYTDEHGYLFAKSKNIAADEGDGTQDDIGPYLVDALMSFDVVKIGNKFMDMASTEDIIRRIEKEKLQ